MRQQQAEDVSVFDVMCQSPHCVTEDQSVGELVSLFVNNGISSAPVVDDMGKPIGFVSKTDVVRELKEASTGARGTIETQLQPWWDTDRLSQLKVGEVMTYALYTLSPSIPLADAIAVMAFEGMHHVPVVTDSGQLVGMLSALDVLEWMATTAGYKPSNGQHGQVFERPA